MRNLEQKIRLKLVQYLRNDLSLRDLRRWLGPILWNLDRSKATGDKRIAYEVALLLDEYGYGHWPEDALRNELIRLLQLPRDVEFAMP